MRTTTILAMVLVCMLSLFVSPAAAISVGERPTFNVKTMEGQTLTNQTLQGRIAVLEFWATWCGPCIQQLPHLRELNARYKDKGVVLISLSRDDNAAVAKRFAASNGMTWTQVHDKGQDRPLGPAWGVRGIPHAFIFAPDGELLWRGHPARIDAPLAEAVKKYGPQLARAKQQQDGADSAAVDAGLEALKGAREAAAAADYAALAKHVTAIPAEALQDRRVIGQGRVLMLRLKTRPDAQPAIESARSEDESFAKAWDALVSAIAPRAAEAGAALLDGGPGGPSARVIAAKLEQAEQARERGQHDRAWDAYEWLVERAGDTAEGQTAQERLEAYAADPELMAVIRTAQAEEEARSMYAMASSYELAGKPELAEELYRKLVDRYGDTPTGGKAKDRLASMR